PDDQYLHDDTCGARIGGDAIRVAMTRALRNQSGQLWVHTHGRHGVPNPSSIDLAEAPNVMRSISNAQPKCIQGWAVISERGVAGQMRALNGSIHALSHLSVCGWPMVVPTRGTRPGTLDSRKERDRYARQGFLGENSQQIFETAKIGI